MNSTRTSAPQVVECLPLHCEGALLTSPPRRRDKSRVVVAMDDERRKRILSDPKVHAAIRSIARRRGVPDTDIDDVVHEVITDACSDARVPLDEVDEARRYLVACCRHKAIDRARARIRDRERLASLDESVPDADSLTVEDRAFARRLLDACRRLFPATHEWFERVAFDNESQAVIAEEMRVSPGHVRHEVSAIRRSLRTLATVAATLLLIATGLRTWSPTWYRGADPVTKPNPFAMASHLRERAGLECAHEEWEACAADLKEAAEIDPAGDTPSVLELRETAERRLHGLDAAPGR